MLLIAGLGNPGSEYRHNRHNIGFMAVDAISRSHHFSPWNKKFQALVCDGTIGGEKVLLLKPQTFMNLSGQAVGEAMRFYKLQPEDLIVIHDELDLLPGKLRVKVGGSSGGHNGIKSIDAHCGNHYRRLRIGIGHPATKDLVTNYVLGNFSKTDDEWLVRLLDAVCDNLVLLVKGNDSQFMNRIALAQSDKTKTTNDGATDGRKKQSDIRQARPKQPKEIPATGPMAEMLKRLFKNKE
ncbi:aminoacyl-tRNA hydrolase [uncultured Bartonella sp.]|uniref:aminoacyl-tRNA hydrolase n=1 Tax=uncultured Bartonella sp. TaxID=104108 RepID=UPI0026149C9F|nr:aminoacyl-tRNA hydrolase [uncultured Bartonella sp.]